MANSCWTSPEITSPATVWEQTRTLNFEVTDYLQLDGMGVGEFISSPVAEVGGYEWNIKFYPDGDDEDCDGHASAFVRCYRQATDPDVTAKLTLSILEKRSQVNVASFDALMCIFSPCDFLTWGHQKFVDKSKLESLSQLGDGCFTIRCVLAVITDEPPSRGLSRELPSQLSSQFESMLEDGRGADVTFRVGSHKFLGHRCVLAARSPVFRAQFYGPMAEKDKPRVKVVDVEPAIFQMMLRYIYADTLPPPPAEGYSVAVMQHLMVAADMYGLERLKLMCEDELCNIMDAATVMSTYVLASQHRCNRLKDECVEFMSSKEMLAAILETNQHFFMTRRRPLSLEGDHEEEEVDHSRKFKRTRTK
ncbi:BTB/POZ and MATH domain-containing protein 2-like [Triticum urartu]|uniref:BTB/POZ and MATH domain-containing protein 2-like n=1 Tax=Triticum urartu TaxID=4572 RepID=UPI002042FA04|nr:BTB/POZ and MATH domain-containing protein 2-like [Triticum urartu]